MEFFIIISKQILIKIKPLNIVFVIQLQFKDSILLWYFLVQFIYTFIYYQNLYEKSNFNLIHKYF